MNKKAKKYIFLALTALGLYGLYMLVMVLLGQPFFVLLLTYAAVIIIIYLINRKNAWAVRGNYFYLMGHHANAKPLLDKAIAANTKSPSAYIYRALLFMREDNDAKKAQELLEKAKPLCSTTIEERNLITALASCLWLDGRVDEGIEALEDMRARHEYVNAGVLTTLGYMYFCKGENEKAIEITEQAMADDPKYGAAWDNMGQIYYKMGDMAAAKENFHEALARKENLADANYYLGLIAEAEGDDDTAKAYFDKANICTIGMFNAVTAEQVAEKCNQYNK